MAALDVTFRSFKTLSPKYLQGAVAYTSKELTDFEPWVENTFGDKIHLPMQRASKKYSISTTGNKYTVALAYHFPESERDPYVLYATRTGLRRGLYGAKNMSFRRLYEILCKRFNNGIYFIDVYFNDSDWFLGDNGIIKGMLSEVLEDVQEKLREYRNTAGLSVPFNKDGSSPDMRYRISREYMVGRSALESSQIQLGLHAVSEKIKQDIVQKLMLGQIPLANPVLAKKTINRKTAAGFPYPGAKFYATGQLIEHISVDLYVWSA